MRALTIRQPWAWAILHAGKRIENRTWRPPDWAVGTVFAIHAGGALEEDGVAWLRRRGFDVPEGFPRAAVVGTARIAAVIDGPVDDPWWEGPVGWLLAEVKPLPEPVPCPGRQGLWKLPEGVMQLLNNK